MLFVLLGMLGVTASHYMIFSNNYVRVKNQEYDFIAKMIGDNVVNSFKSLSWVFFEESLHRIIENKNIKHIYIIDERGEIYQSSDKEYVGKMLANVKLDIENSMFTEYSFDIRSGKTWKIILLSSKEEFDKLREEMISRFIAVSSYLGALIFIGIIFVSKYVCKPFSKLTEITQKMTKDGFFTLSEDSVIAEVSVLIGSFNSMSTSLKARELSLQQAKGEAEIVGKELKEHRDNLELEIKKRTSEIRESEEQYRALFGQAADSILLIDIETGVLVEFNDVAHKTLGYSRKEFESIKTSDFEVKEQNCGIGNSLGIVPREDGGERFEAKHMTKDGRIRIVLVNSKTISVKGKDFNLSVYHDITDRKLAEEKIEHLAYYDSLTNLPNRFMFIESLEHELNRAKRNKDKVAVLFIDLDRFKNVNDTLGHDVGDVLLKEVSRRLEDCIRKHDIVARLGGDEFTIVLTQVKSSNNVTVVSERILKAIRPTFDISGHNIYITPSIGISLYPDNGTDVKNLVKNADTAMYCAKDTGKNNYKFYNLDMNKKISRLMELETGLCEALENDEFVLHYQPLMDLKTHEIVGVEALLRWQHPKRGLLSPGNFISVAEETGLILPISVWVLKNACAQNKMWQENGHKPINVAVNVSAKHFCKTGFEKFVNDVLNETSLDAKWLDIEITETAIIEESVFALEILTNLSNMGIKLSLDDFGTGYSSLSYLKVLPINTVKIDCSFIRDITSDSGNAAIAKAVIAMSHEMGLRVVAEGIEYVQQLEFLRNLNCDIGQGYLFSHPLPAHEMTKLLASSSQILC